MCVRELLTVLDGRVMVKLILDGYGALFTGTADRAPLEGMHRFGVAKIMQSDKQHLTVLCVEEG